MQKDRQEPRSSPPKETTSDSFGSPEKWCLRQEISSTPMFTNPLNRSGSSTSAETRWHIAPTVRHATRANVATVDLSERGHGGLVRTGHQPHHQVLKVGREPRTGAGERDPFGDDTMDGAGQSPPAHPQPARAPAQVQMPPRRVNITAVIPAERRERTHRAGQHPPPQADVDDH